MIISRVCMLRWRNVLGGLGKRSRLSEINDASTSNAESGGINEENKSTLSSEAQDILKKMLPSLKSGDEPEVSKKLEMVEPDDEIYDKKSDMDVIRARGFLKCNYNYTPPDDLQARIGEVVEHLNLSAENFDADFTQISLAKDLHLKFRLLNLLADKFCHAVPNSELHRLNTVGDVIDFYSQPVSNLTDYTEMARGIKRTLPKNLHIMENPVRFHPEDTHAHHGGVTAFPGEGGNVISLRNKRLYRQFKPKKEWFDYEEEVFDHTKPDKNMPWDPEIAERMDRYPSKKYNLRTKLFRKI